LYRAQGAYAKAEPLYLRALTISEKALGPEHPSTGTRLNNLAALYRAQGAYAKAEPLYLRALTISEKALGPEHPSTLVGVENLTLVAAQEDRWTDVAVRFRRLLSSTRHRRDLAYGRDTEKLRALGSRQFFTSILHAGVGDAERRKEFLPLLLRAVTGSKARLADEAQAALESMKRRVGGEDRQSLVALEEVWQKQSALWRAASPEEAQVQEMAALSARESDLMAAISVRSAEFRKLTDEPSPAKLATALRGRVLVEIVRLARFQPKAGEEKLFGDPLYTALLLFPDGRIEMVDLGGADGIDRLVRDYRLANEVADNCGPMDELAARLGEIILAPIVKLTGKATDWYVAPDGALRLIPFGGLRMNGRYAASQFQIQTLGSGRDLLRLDLAFSSGTDDVVFANPNFGDGNGGFVALPETEAEAAAIRRVLPNAQIVDEGKRGKAFLLGLEAAPRILHLATHAFYHSGAGGDPLLRGGIALDGANAGADGVLTAKEAQTLRLRGTQLAVMSACETGVGEVSFGEGLVGLQRSLMMAGARSQMLTLWPVNSERTIGFMERFYRKLAGGMAKGEAWLTTQRELIDEGVAPHFWAPFVLYGDPGPLGER
jgi:hypothetical protein